MDEYEKISKQIEAIHKDSYNFYDTDVRKKENELAFLEHDYGKKRPGTKIKANLKERITKKREQVKKTQDKYLKLLKKKDELLAKRKTFEQEHKENLKKREEAKAKRKKNIKKRTKAIYREKAREINYSRPKQALSRDMKTTSKKTYSPTIKNFNKWKKNPGKSDLKGVDTKDETYRSNTKRFANKTFKVHGDYNTKEFALMKARELKKTHYYRLNKETHSHPIDVSGRGIKSNYTLYTLKKLAKPKKKQKPKKTVQKKLI